MNINSINNMQSFKGFDSTIANVSAEEIKNRVHEARRATPAFNISSMTNHPADLGLYTSAANSVMLEKVLANQDKILENQNKILENQEKLISGKNLDTQA